MQVRPRRIWIGVFATTAGMVLAGIALTFLPWQPWGWIGLVLIATGAVLALLGGIMHDVYGGQHGVAGEGKAAIGGETRSGAAPGTMVPVQPPIPDEPVTANAGAAEGAHLEPAPRPIRMQLLAFGMILLGGWMILAPTVLHNLDTETGNDVVLRDYAVAAVVLLTGLGLRNTRRPLVVCAAPALAGAALLLAAALSPPLTTRLLVSEVISGLLAISLAAGYAVLRQSRA